MFCYCSLVRFDSDAGDLIFMQSDFESALIGINHLAERLGLSRRTIQRILAKGDLPSLQIGRRRLVRLSELSRWLDGRVAQPQDQNITKTA